MVDAFVVAGKLESAKELATQVLKEFVDAKLNLYAIRALGYLHDLLDTAANPRAAVRHVRTYVEKLREEPTLLFIPLDEKR